MAYTGTIKLKQSWLDQFEDANSAESKILAGNIEQAVSRKDIELDFDKLI